MKAAPFLLILTLIGQLAMGESELPHIEVYGMAKREVAPDELHWNVSVKTTGAAVAEVAEKQADSVSGILDYLRESGVDPEKLKTSRMQLNENWIYRNQSRIKDGYFAGTLITFQTNDFDKYQELWEGLSQFENLSIGGVNYDVSNRIQIQDEIRIEALAAAKEKAEAMAKALGTSILEPLKIEEIEEPDHGRPMLSRSAALSESGAESGFASPGLETIYARVKLTFRIATN